MDADHPKNRGLIPRRFTLRRANSELAEANRRLHHLASTDTLTGMRTRSAFFEAMDISRELYSVGVLLMVDADHFKPINDRYGHLSGDIVLKEIAEAIRNSLRNGDIAGRLGGEEFAVYLPDTDPEAARAVAETIRRSVAALDLRSLGNDEIGVTVSIGIAPTRDRSRSQLLAAADRQLYRAKDEGRNRCSSE